jgi:hypothetical protein
MKPILVSVLIFISISISAQRHIVYIDDTLYVHKLDPHHYSLKDSLPDGMWFLHNLVRNDSAKADRNTLIMSGGYLNYLKHGTHQYYKYIEKRDEIIIVEKEEFLRGRRNGIAFYSEGDIYGSYENNLPHGLWIIQYKHSFWECGPKNGIARSRFVRFFSIPWPNFFSCRINRRILTRKGTEHVVSYDHGVVQQWSSMSRFDGRVYNIGFGNLLEGKCHVIVFHKSGLIYQEFFFNDGCLTDYKEYDKNGNVAKEFNYQFVTTSNIDQICKNVIIRNEFSFALIDPTPYDGFIIEYDENGLQIKMTEYKGGLKL